MKRICTKIPAMIGMVFTLLASLFLMKMLIYLLFPALLDDGTTFYEPDLKAWQCSLSVMLFSAFGMVFYVTDAIFSFIKAMMKTDRTFHMMLTVAALAGLGIGIWVITTPLRTYKTVIWFSYYFLVLSVPEIISLVRCIRQRPKKESRKELTQ